MTFIPNSDYFLDISKGNVPKHTSDRKFGFSANLSTSEQVISFNSGTTPYFPIAAQSLSIVSNSALDTNTAGTGARKIYVEGLDANFDIQTEVINLLGAVPVVSANTWMRINRVYVSDTGTYGSNNAGNITLSNGAAGIFMVIEAGKGEGQSTKYTVPNGYTAYVMQVHFSVETSKQVNIKFWKRQNANDVVAGYTPKLILQNYYGVSGTIDWTYVESPFVLPAYTDIWFTGKTTSGAAEASVEYPFILVQN